MNITTVKIEKENNRPMLILLKQVLVIMVLLTKMVMLTSV